MQPSSDLGSDLEPEEELESMDTSSESESGEAHLVSRSDIAEHVSDSDEVTSIVDRSETPDNAPSGKQNDAEPILSAVQVRHLANATLTTLNDNS